MTLIFAHKRDSLDLIEVERIEPVPETENGQETGRELELRYRTYRSEDEWTPTTKGLLTRTYRPLNGRQAKELISPSEEEEPASVAEVGDPPSPSEEEAPPPKRKLFKRRASKKG